MEEASKDKEDDEMEGEETAKREREKEEEMAPNESYLQVLKRVVYLFIVLPNRSFSRMIIIGYYLPRLL